MSCEFQVPDGRDFESVFARGVAGVETGYKNVVGDDLGTYFAGGGSDVKTGMVTSGGSDLGDIFRSKGDADLQLLNVMANKGGGKGTFEINFPANSFGVLDGAPGKFITNDLDQAEVLYVHKAIMAGKWVVLDVYWGKDDHSYKNNEGLPSGYKFSVSQTPTVADPRFVWTLYISTGRSELTTLSFKVIANIYLN